VRALFYVSLTGLVLSLALHLTTYVFARIGDSLPRSLLVGAGAMIVFPAMWRDIGSFNRDTKRSLIPLSRRFSTIPNQMYGIVTIAAAYG